MFFCLLLSLYFIQSVLVFHTILLFLFWQGYIFIYLSLTCFSYTFLLFDIYALLFFSVLGSLHTVCCSQFLLLIVFCHLHHPLYVFWIAPWGQTKFIWIELTIKWISVQGFRGTWVHFFPHIQVQFQTWLHWLVLGAPAGARAPLKPVVSFGVLMEPAPENADMASETIGLQVATKQPSSTVSSVSSVNAW